MSHMTIFVHSFNGFERPSKGRIFIMDAISKWAPGGFFTWITNSGKIPAMVRLRENKEYAHEVAAKLIDEKRQYLKDGGSSRRDILTLLGSSALHLWIPTRAAASNDSVKANSALRPHLQMNEEEVLAQIR